MIQFYTGILQTDEPSNKTCLQREEQIIQSIITYKKPSVKGLKDYMHEVDRRLKGMESNVSEKLKLHGDRVITHLPLAWFGCTIQPCLSI